MPKVAMKANMCSQFNITMLMSRSRKWSAQFFVPKTDRTSVNLQVSLTSLKVQSKWPWPLISCIKDWIHNCVLFFVCLLLLLLFCLLLFLLLLFVCLFVCCCCFVFVSFFFFFFLFVFFLGGGIVCLFFCCCCWCLFFCCCFFFLPSLMIFLFRFSKTTLVNHKQTSRCKTE